MTDELLEPATVAELLAALPDMPGDDTEHDDDTAEITKQHRAHGLRVADIKQADRSK